MRGSERRTRYQRSRERADSAWAPRAKRSASHPGPCTHCGTTRTRHPPTVKDSGRDAGRDQPAGTTALIGQLISTIFFNIDILGRMQLPFLADPGTGRSWYDRADPEEWRVSSPDATMTAAGAAESVGGGEAVGMPSLRQAASALAAALSQGTTVAREAGRLG